MVQLINICFFVLCLGLGNGFSPHAQFQCRSVQVSAATGGFAKDTRRKKNRGSGGSVQTTNAADLTPKNGWVELVDLDRTLLDTGKAQAIGRSISGKPYLIRRSSAGFVTASAVECGRCQYPLLKVPVVSITLEDGQIIDEGTCSVCGSKYDATTGAARPSDGGGNPLVAPLLRNKPQADIPTFDTKELDDGRVFVQINPRGNS